MTGFFK